MKLKEQFNKKLLDSTLPETFFLVFSLIPFLQCAKSQCSIIVYDFILIHKFSRESHLLYTLWLSFEKAQHPKLLS